MAGANILFPQFREEQSDSKYPFADFATLQSQDGRVSFKKDVFVDAVFYPIGGGSAAYISRVVVAVSKVTITVETVDPVVSVSASYDPLLLPVEPMLSFQDAYGRPAGNIVFNLELIAEIYQWGFGAYDFNRAGTEIVATAFIPAQEPGVRALTLDGKNFLTGDVVLIGADGVVLRAETGNVIRVDIVGVPLFNRAACEDAGKITQPPRFVSTINGCAADEFGNFTITASNRGIPAGVADTTVMRVYPTNAGLVIATAGRSDI
jgi:hypothetical protein